LKILKISEATIVRLSVYSRYLDQIDKKGISIISSSEIAEGIGVSPAQVRKDLACFGEFGTRGVGYNAKDLHRQIMKILGLHHSWPVVIVGAGNLGTALSMYGGFRSRGFRVIAIFDNDPHKIGYKLSGIEIYPMSEMANIISKAGNVIGIIAVPAEYAQTTATLLVNAGVKAILNFAPRALTLPEEIIFRNVDLSVNLEILTFNLSFRKGK